MNHNNYEEITSGAITYSVHYVYSPDRLVAMVVKYDSAGNSYEKIYGVITDRQGSIMALHTTQGDIVFETSYDAWGRERSPADADYSSITTRPVWLIRGYTGHEMLPEFGLINMNGRLYDPLLCRMLSPDNFACPDRTIVSVGMQDATSTQGYNRYAYVYNNPLKYKEIDGEIPVIVIPIVIGALAGGYVGYQIGKAEGAEGWEMAGYVVSGGIIGGAAGFLGGAVGGAIAGANFAGSAALGAVAGGGVAGGLAGAGYASLAGNDVGEGAWKGAVSGAAGGFVGGAIGGGWGAFFGGATASGLGTALYGGTPEQIAINSVLGGLTGWGSYELSTYANYKFNYRGNLNYGGYRKVQAAIQRSQFWETEWAWYETASGDVSGMHMGDLFGDADMQGYQKPADAIYEAHTHTRLGIGNEYFGPTDMSTIPIEAKNSGLNYKVYGWKNVYVLTNDKAGLLNPSYNGDWYKINYLNYANKMYNELYAYPNHLNIGGISHGFSLYFQNIFLFIK